jgi:hypothetical protein
MDVLIKTIAWAAPISAVLVTALFWLLRNWLTVRLTRSIGHEYDQSLATHQAQLKGQFDRELEERKAELKLKADLELEIHRDVINRIGHASQAQFDMEFASYQKLWAALAKSWDENVRLTRLYALSEKQKGGKRAYADAADGAYFQANTVCQELRPFITESIYTKAEDIVAMFKHEIDQFYADIKSEAQCDSNYNQTEAGKAAVEAVNEISQKCRELADEIRTRLATLASASVPSK